MWYRIKMWWFLKEFGKQLNLHTLLQEDLSVGKVITSTSDFFIEGNDEWPGLAKRSSKRFSKILWWRKKNNPEKIKKRILEYNDIFISCINDGYIRSEIWQEVGQKLVATNPIKGHLYDESRGIAGLVQVVGKKFPAMWAFIGWIITVIIGVLAYIFKK